MAVRHGIDLKNIPEEFSSLGAIKQRAAEERYRMFSHYYVNNGLNAKQAAISAGYSPDSASAMSHDLLEITYVQDWITKLQSDKKAAAVITYDYLVQGLEDARQACMEGRTNKDGTYDAKSLAKVTEVLNKMYGYDAPQKTFNVHMLSDASERDAAMKKILEDNLKDY